MDTQSREENDEKRFHLDLENKRFLLKSIWLAASYLIGAKCWWASLIFMRQFSNIYQSHLHDCDIRGETKINLKLLSKRYFFVLLYSYDTLKTAAHIFGEKSFAVSRQSHERLCT